MKQEILETHRTDEKGNPTGGTTTGTGLIIKWQDGPLGRGAERSLPNGAFVEGVIQAAIGRLEFYQASKFKCDTNARALNALNIALAALEERTKDREARAVEGLHEA